jgi:3-hydroxy-3-methylglutaryl CoA synthase
MASGDADAPVLAEPIAAASVTAEFLERWRMPGDPASRQWEERFGEHAYGPLAEAAVASALKQAGLTGSELASVIVAGSHGRANKRAAAVAGAKPTAVGDDLTARWATPARPTRGCSWRTSSIGRRPTTSSWSFRWPTAAT